MTQEETLNRNVEALAKFLKKQGTNFEEFEAEYYSLYAKGRSLVTYFQNVPMELWLREGFSGTDTKKGYSFWYKVEYMWYNEMKYGG